MIKIGRKMAIDLIENFPIALALWLDAEQSTM